MTHVDFWFDPISPYAWLAFERLPEAFVGLSYSVAYRPIVFGALLKHHAHKGPAEIEPKRAWTFRQVHWLARRAQIELATPLRHPFNSLALSRLAWATAAPGSTPNRYACETVLRHVWVGGADAEDPARFAALRDGLAPAVDPAATRPSNACALPPIKRSRSGCSACRRSASRASSSGAWTRSTWLPPSCAATIRSSSPCCGNARARPAGRHPPLKGVPVRAARGAGRTRPGWRCAGFTVDIFIVAQPFARQDARCHRSTLFFIQGEFQHGHSNSADSAGTEQADDARRAQGHLRLEPRHRLRVVRLLPLRLARRASSPSSSSRLDPTAAFIFALLAFAAGFLVRPFGALVFGRLGDMIGRKYTFLVTILIMGVSTVVGRPPARLRLDRHRRARSSWSPCACCRAWRWAASTAAPRPTSPSMRRTASAARSPRGSRPRRRSACSCRCW